MLCGMVGGQCQDYVGSLPDDAKRESVSRRYEKKEDNSPKFITVYIIHSRFQAMLAHSLQV
jgi:hypothetical protein